MSAMPRAAAGRLDGVQHAPLARRAVAVPRRVGEQVQRDVVGLRERRPPGRQQLGRGGPRRARPASRAGSCRGRRAARTARRRLRAAHRAGGHGAQARRRTASAIGVQPVAPRRRRGPRRRGARARRGPRRPRAAARTSASRSGSSIHGSDAACEVAEQHGRDRLAARRDPPATRRRAELVGRPAAGHEHRQAAGHRLEHGHREALAAVRVHEHVAGAVQRREPARRRGRRR